MTSNWKKHREKRLFLGLCRDCGKEPHRKSAFTCKPCGDKACARVKERYKNLRFDVLYHYCGGRPRCQCPGCNCAILAFLTLDHVYGNGAKHRQTLGQRRKNGVRISGRALPYWLKENKYPEGFQVLCMNCNFGKGIQSECPRQGQSHVE
jgi:hypothetical protein